ncbi:hypothetical protein D3C76_1673580 [compost metagenome]
MPPTDLLACKLAIGGAKQGIAGAQQQPTVARDERLVIGVAAQWPLIQQQLAVMRAIGQIVDYQQLTTVHRQCLLDLPINPVVVTHQPLRA